MIKAFCDSCDQSLGPVQVRTEAELRKHHVNVSVKLGDVVVRTVQLTVVAADGAHLCSACAWKAIELAWNGKGAALDEAESESQDTA